MNHTHVTDSDILIRSWLSCFRLTLPHHLSLPLVAGAESPAPAPAFVLLFKVCRLKTPHTHEASLWKGLSCEIIRATPEDDQGLPAISPGASPSGVNSVVT